MGRLLEGQVATVVGVGPGLGSAIALELAEAGASLVLVSRTQAVLTDVAGQIESKGGRATIIVADLDNSEDHARLAETVMQNHGAVDILVHNAARHGVQNPFAEADMDDWRQTMNTNVFAPLHLTQALLPALRESKAASIVFVSAMAMRMVSSVGRAGYAISKAAINQSVRSLAYELAKDGIRVNAVVPGWMDSAHVESWRNDPKLAPMVDRALNAIPLGRIPLPEEVAGSVVYLASAMSSVVTGACLDVNGGHFMAA